MTFKCLTYWSFVVKDDTQIIPARLDPILHCAAPTPIHVNAEHGSVFGFRPNVHKDPNSGMSAVLASHCQEEAQDPEPSAIGIVVIIFAFFSFLTLISDEEDIYASGGKQGIILYAVINYYWRALLVPDEDIEQEMAVVKPSEEPEIDEISPDEDERQAIQSLRAPKQSTKFICWTKLLLTSTPQTNTWSRKWKSLSHQRSPLMRILQTRMKGRHRALGHKNEDLVAV